jgi:hypothetical protein
MIREYQQWLHGTRSAYQREYSAWLNDARRFKVERPPVKPDMSFEAFLETQQQVPYR